MEERDALYYPYIHVRNLDWLKATLLCFPHVLRMVPSDFHLNDSSETREFTKVMGRRKEPLLGTVELIVKPAEVAQSRLLEKLKGDYEQQGEDFLSRFSREKASGQFDNGDSAFQIHRYKFTNELLKYLMKKQLAWYPRDPNRGEGSKWIGVHPTMGEAIMSTIAASIAKHNGLDIVTSSGKVHAALADRDQDAIYDSFIRGLPMEHPPDKDGTVNELVQLVIMTRFDISQLSARDIVGLSKGGEGLFAFKKAVAEVAQTIPQMPNRERRDQYLKEKADELIEQWKEHKRGMSKFAREFFGAGLFKDAGDSLKKIATSIAGGATAGSAAGATASAGGAAMTTGTLIGGLAVPTLLGIGAGMAVGVVIHGISTAVKQYRREVTSPYRYFSRIEKAGATLIATTAAITEANNPQN
jgi:hypothetical protein